MTRDEALTISEHARLYCVETMPLRTAQQARMYLLTMKTLDGAWWDVVRGERWELGGLK